MTMACSKITDKMEFDLPSVADYYSGKSVFITGGTGFIGKVLIEKLLRSCPKLDKVYLLIRPKRSQDIGQRMEELVKCPVYDKLRKDQPNFRNKLYPINGDICQPGLGVSQADREILEKNVHIVFHSAATVRFDAPLRVAVEMNVLAVRKLVQLCKNFTALEVFVHVSTAYANCDRPFIEEYVYEPPVEPQKLIDAMEWMDDEMIDQITPQLIGGKPNTYTYTKQLAEHLLVKEAGDMPVAIVRPSIVGASWKEPLPGWIDNYNGMSGLYVAVGKGFLRTMKVNMQGVADIIPVDIPVNMLITVAWYTAVMKPHSVLIYHSTSGAVNPLTWGEMVTIGMPLFTKLPFEKCFRRPKLRIQKYGFIHDFYVMVSHLIPAYITDFCFYLLGKKTRMIPIYSKLHQAVGTLTYFTNQKWEWTYNNLDMLISHMTPEDKQKFYFDPRRLHWPTYMEDLQLGTKKYLLKEDMAGIPAARAHIKKLRNITYACNTVLGIVLWRTLVARSQFARNLWYLIIRLVMKFVRFFRLTSTLRTS